MNATLRNLDALGFAVVAGALSVAEIAGLVALTDALPSAKADEARGGYPDLCTLLPAVRKLAGHPGIRRWPAAVLGPGCFAVRATLFDKTPDANWKVAWHQDVTIPIRERVERPGYGSWSSKSGIPHVQPPVAVLENMLTVRIHLDPCGLDNGPVRVLPGSHRQGRLRPGAIFDWKERVATVTAPCAAGGLLLMRPLLLHASSASTAAGDRRVIHLEYAAGPLPEGLRWHDAWGGRAGDAA